MLTPQEEYESSELLKKREYRRGYKDGFRNGFEAGLKAEKEKQHKEFLGEEKGRQIK